MASDMQPLHEIILRPAASGEAAALTELCLRSKAHWGYDAAFLAACRDELTVSEAVASGPLLHIATVAGVLAAMAEIGEEDGTWHVEKLFVDPPFMGLGLGQRLLDWAARTAAEQGATSLEIAADPSAAPFYRRCGAVDAGEIPSGSIPGRFLPRLVLQIPR
jgi:GNAT superfamily N-acetyltransferase